MASGGESAFDKAKKLLDDFGLTKVDEVRQLLDECMAEARTRGDTDAEAEAMRLMIDIHLAKKQYADAIKLAEKVAGLSPDKVKQARGHCLIGQIRLTSGEGNAQTLAAFNKAKALYNEAGDKVGEAEVLGIMSQLHWEAGDADEAMQVAREAVALSSDAMTAMQTIAQIHLARGQVAAAVEQATEMLAACKDKGNKAGQAAANLTLSNAFLLEDEASMDGLRCGRDALSLFQELGDIFGAQSTLHTLANGYFARGDLEEGLKCAREALTCFRQTGDSSSAEVLKATIDQARAMTQEWRKQYPKRPFVLPPSATMPTVVGPEVCPLTESSVPADALDFAAAGRKYWGVPHQVEVNPAVGATERAPTHTVIWGMCLSDNTPTQVCVEFGDLIVCMSKGDVPKIPIVVMTCGVYGRQTGELTTGSMTNVAAATMWGMVRTARQEMPSIIVQMLDYAEGFTSAEIPRTIRPALPESAYYGKARWEPQIAAVPSLFRRELRRDNLTGGGGGGVSDERAKKTNTKFLRKTFSWTGPTHKLDYCWYRQEWRACGPAFGDVGPMPPPPPCRAMRSY